MPINFDTCSIERRVAKPDHLFVRPVIVRAKSSESSEQEPSDVARIVSTTFLENQEDAMNPGDVQLCAQSELQGGESLLWSGPANPGRSAMSALPAALFGIPFAGFAFFWMSTAYRGTHNLANHHNTLTSGFSVFPLFGLPFLLIGLAMTLAPLGVYLKGRSGVYAVTNRRVMLITGTTSRSVKSIIPTDIAEVDHRERPDGTGDVLIRTNSVMRTNNGTTQITVGLYGVPNVKEVAGLVMNLRAQPVAS
jgi:Bacterial PH domain